MSRWCISKLDSLFVEQICQNYSTAKIRLREGNQIGNLVFCTELKGHNLHELKDGSLLIAMCAHRS